VLHLLGNFLRLKKSFRIAGRSAKFRILHGISMEFGRKWTYMPNKRVSFILMDLRDTPRHSVLEDHVN
jgi:hypothetical protein